MGIAARSRPHRADRPAGEPREGCRGSIETAPGGLAGQRDLDRDHLKFEKPVMAYLGARLA